MSASIVVTGTSAWHCFGRGVERLVDALDAGERGLRKVEGFSVDDRFFVMKDAMQVRPDWDTVSKERWPGDWGRDEKWSGIFGVEAAVDAFTDAGAAGRYEPARVAVVAGTSHGINHELLEYLRVHFQGEEPPDPYLLENGAAHITRHIAQRLDARGVAMLFNTACSAGLSAIGMGARLIEQGRADCVIAGGYDAFSLLSFSGFTSLRAMDPSGAHPFDVARAGMSLGDGAAFCVLEREERAQARSAVVKAKIAGYASRGEAYHPTAPDPDGKGALRAMLAALAGDASARDLNFVCAHGTGTEANDPAEVSAVQMLIEHVGATGPVWMSSLKGNIGHTLGATGALQVVSTIECMRRGIIPATADLKTPVPHTAPLSIPRETVRAAIDLALCNAFGFGGSVAALALRPPDP